jgi:hypothetical protein
MPNLLIVSVFMLNVFMLRAGMLNVVMLSVVAPFEEWIYWTKNYNDINLSLL